jgi:hypothetical protein
MTAEIAEQVDRLDLSDQDSDLGDPETTKPDAKKKKKKKSM